MNRLLKNLRDSENNYEYTNELIIAVKNRDYAQAEIALSNPEVDVNDGGRYGYTALHRAIKFRDIKMINILLAHRKLNINCYAYSNPLLEYCIYFGSTEIFKLLLKQKGINRNIICSHNQTVLETAIRAGIDPIINLLLQHPGINTEGSIEDQSFLKVLIRERKYKLAAMLIPHRAFAFIKINTLMVAILMLSLAWFVSDFLLQYAY